VVLGRTARLAKQPTDCLLPQVAESEEKLVHRLVARKTEPLVGVSTATLACCQGGARFVR
jgi:hypothetical protein